MRSIATVRKKAWIWLAAHRLELGLCSRVTVSAVATLLIAQLLHLRLALWAVLTAVILTQMSVGRSLKATTDYLAGTLGGAVFAGAVGALIPHETELSLALTLAVTLIPVTLVAATNPRFSVAPFTAVIVFLAPTIIHLPPIASAFERLMEVVVGCAVGLIVSFVVLPAHAYDQTIDAAGRMLRSMAHVLPRLFAGCTQNIDEATILGLQDKLGQAYGALDAMAIEGTHERVTHLISEPDLGPLLRTLLRLRHDFVMIGRTAAVPLPAACRAFLGPALDSVSEAASHFLHANGSALMARRPPASRQVFEASLQAYAAKMDALRQQDLTELSTDAMERIFALAFVLEQMHRNLGDLERCVADYSQSRTSDAKPRVRTDISS